MKMKTRCALGMELFFLQYKAGDENGGTVHTPAIWYSLVTETGTGLRQGEKNNTKKQRFVKLNEQSVIDKFFPDDVL